MLHYTVIEANVAFADYVLVQLLFMLVSLRKGPAQEA